MDLRKDMNAVHYRFLHAKEIFSALMWLYYCIQHQKDVTDMMTANILVESSVGAVTISNNVATSCLLRYMFLLHRYNLVIRKVNYFWFESLTLKQHCRIMGFFLFIILFCYRGPPAVRECNSLQHNCHKYKSLFDSPHPIDSNTHAFIDKLTPT